jgi:hypothetical protein
MLIAGGGHEYTHMELDEAKIDRRLEWSAPRS